MLSELSLPAGEDSNLRKKKYNSYPVSGLLNHSLLVLKILNKTDFED